MTLEGQNRLMFVVPQTYGEMIVLYPWVDCESHEWDNRTTLENAAWLIAYLVDDIKKMRE